MIPNIFKGRMSVPVIAAPMFLVSGPHLVIEACKAGVAGTFPTLNARPIEVLDEWLTQINAELGAALAANPSAAIAPYGVNLILHHSNKRLEQDFALVVKHKVPFVITSLGHPGEVVKAVHAYGGVVFSDVIHAYHARKAIAAGVDGIVCVAAGAGGHAGTQSPFSLVREIREFWDGAQDGHHRHLAPGDALHLGRAAPAIDGDVLEREVGGGLVGEQARELVGQFAEFLGRDLELAQEADLVLDQRVADVDDGHDEGSGRDVRQSTQRAAAGSAPPCRARAGAPRRRSRWPAG